MVTIQGAFASSGPAMDDPDVASLLEAAMQVPVTVWLGPMGPLLRKLHWLMAPGESLAPALLSKDDIRLLSDGLKDLCISLNNMSEREVGTSFMARWWMKIVRELCYDTEDHLDEIYDGTRAHHRFSWLFAREKVDFSGLLARAKDASESLERVNWPPKTTGPDWGETGVSRLTSLELVHVEPPNKLVELLDLDDHDDLKKTLKVIPITGCAGVGKTTVARALYHRHAWKFQCRAFITVSRNPDIRGFLTSMLSQLKAPRPHGFPDVPDLIDAISKHLQCRRYFIVIDDLWTASVWSIISRGFPRGDHCSRIIAITQIDDVALACCSYDSDYIYKMEPLNDHESRKLFFGRVFGSEDSCPTDIKEVSYEIIRKCGGFPLAIVSAASLLATKSNIEPEKWKHIQDFLSFSSFVEEEGRPTDSRGRQTNRKRPAVPASTAAKDNLGLSGHGMSSCSAEIIDVLNLLYNRLAHFMYNSLPPRLTTCLLYLGMYSEGYVIKKDELVKQWVAEGFLSAVGGLDTEEIAGGYFDELVNRGMVQAVDTNYNGDVLSCTVHQMVLDFIRHKCMEENFIITVDYFQSTLALPDKVRRLSVQFGGVKSAYISETVVTSHVRSLIFWGFFECVPSVTDFGLLRVLILHIWADQGKTSYDLTRIGELLQLKYIKIECNIAVKLPGKIKGLQHLETLQVDARLSAVPSDIFNLKRLLHLRLPSESMLPSVVAHMTSLRTLGYFDIGSHSNENVLHLGRLTNLQDLQLTCSRVRSAEKLEMNVQLLRSILDKLRFLQSLTLVPAASGSSCVHISEDDFSMASPPTPDLLLRRIELSRRCCIFFSLPKGFGELRKLCILKIAIRELPLEDTYMLKGLPALAALTLYVKTAPAERIFIDKGGFQVLTYFKFTCATPCLFFVQGAMPKVQKLKLGFNSNEWRSSTFENVGFCHLTGLTEVSVKLGARRAREINIKVAEPALEAAVRYHPNSPTIRVQLVDVISCGEVEVQEIRDGKKKKRERSEEKRLEIEEGKKKKKERSDEHVKNSRTKSAIGMISSINKSVPLFQWPKSAISSLHSLWSGSQEQSHQDRVLRLESGLQRLRDTFPTMHDLINKIEWRSHKHNVAKLLPNLKDAVAEAEDFLDEFRWYEMKVQVERNASQSNFVDFFNTVIQGSFSQLNDIQLRLNHLSSQLESMGLHGVTQCFDKLVRPKTTSFPIEQILFGREEELENVLGLLNVIKNLKRKRVTSSVKGSTRTSTSNLVSNESRISSLPVLAIVGIGGVGKSALAQHICNHRRVKSHFDLIIWICVADDFDVERLTKEVIQSCTGKEATTDNLDSLQHALSNHVNNRKLMIVLDDMWDDALKDNGQRWKRFCAPFRGVKEGSVMLVTTRCLMVAEGVCTMEPVRLLGLRGEAFWNFFKSCVFGSVNSDNDHQLECIARSILPELRGSPLAAKTLGRMLRKNVQAKHWNFILESGLWKFRQDETDILPALRLSYIYLPFYLKQCFSFCAVYPKQYKFQKAHLAEIWVAEGFVEPQGGVPCQDIACQYFEDLVRRSFFQKVSCGSSEYVIDDLLHDMVQKVSEHDCFILQNKSDFDKVPQNVRHLYVLPSSDLDDSSLLRLCKYTKLRTLICKKELWGKTSFVMDHWCAKLLRMRVFSCAFINELPDNIGNWKHLRYLEISRACPLKRIPSSSCWLYNLQILYAKNCKLESLPNDFGKLISLQKFESHQFTYYDGCRMHFYSPSRQRQGIMLLKNLNQFRGHLEISHVGLLNKDQAAEAELENKKYLHGLTLNVCTLHGSQSILDNVIEVLEVLQPPMSLKSLFLQNYGGVSLPSWFHPQNLPSLKSLTFENCVGLKSISISMVSQSTNSHEIPAVLVDNNDSIGSFLSLADLTIDSCQNLSSYIDSQRLVSASLNKLSLRDSGLFCNIDCRSLTYFNLSCESVTSIQLETWSLPTLQELHIKCKSLTFVGGTGRNTSFLSLNVLTVTFCHKLTTLDYLLAQECLPAIEKICIECCPKLLSLPGERFGSFPYLKHMVVLECPSLNWRRGLVLPSSLQSLILQRCGDISPFVPCCLQNLTSLVTLRIIGCQGIKSIPGNIWRSNLASLKELEISDCPKLVSIGGAYATAKIKKVMIHKCPKLKEAE